MAWKSRLIGSLAAVLITTACSASSLFKSNRLTKFAFAIP